MSPGNGSTGAIGFTIVFGAVNVAAGLLAHVDHFSVFRPGDMAIRMSPPAETMDLALFISKFFQLTAGDLT
jgi:hypothetical protein